MTAEMRRTINSGSKLPGTPIWTSAPPSLPKQLPRPLFRQVASGSNAKYTPISPNMIPTATT